MKIKINKDIYHASERQMYKAGQIIELQSYNNNPIEKFWQNRLTDSILDKCIEVIQNEELEIIKKKK